MEDNNVRILAREIEMGRIYLFLTHSYQTCAEREFSYLPC